MFEDQDDRPRTILDLIHCMADAEMVEELEDFTRLELFAAVAMHALLMKVSIDINDPHARVLENVAECAFGVSCAMIMHRDLAVERAANHNYELLGIVPAAKRDESPETPPAPPARKPGS